VTRATMLPVIGRVEEVMSDSGLSVKEHSN
jgi:hypothetical protein